MPRINRAGSPGANWINAKSMALAAISVIASVPRRRRMKRTPDFATSQTKPIIARTPVPNSKGAIVPLRPAPRRDSAGLLEARVGKIDRLHGRLVVKPLEPPVPHT